MKDLVIGIVGNGNVGRALARAYCESVKEVRVYDIDKNKSTHTVYEVVESNLVFVCLPTPMLEGGSCYTGTIRKFFLPWSGTNINFVIKSTVHVGFTEHMSQLLRLPNLVHSPEFLTQRCALHDAANPSRNVIGVPSRLGINTCGRLLQQFYLLRNPQVPTAVCHSNTSELIKLAVNSYYASKVAWFNELREVCESLDCDWDLLLTGMLLDGKISEHHTKVPGPDGKYGFGGECLPKDLSNLIKCAEVNNAYVPILRAVQERNGKDREKKS